MRTGRYSRSGANERHGGITRSLGYGRKTEVVGVGAVGGRQGLGCGDASAVHAGGDTEVRWRLYWVSKSRSCSLADHQGAGFVLLRLYLSYIAE